MTPPEAVALALRYIEGARVAGTMSPEQEAAVFLEHLAGHGFLVRPRDGSEHRQISGSRLERRNVSRADIRAMREAVGLGIGALAALAGVSSKAISEMESGGRAPQAKTVAAVLDALARASASG